jgi:hypothetical protein
MPMVQAQSKLLEGSGLAVRNFILVANQDETTESAWGSRCYAVDKEQRDIGDKPRYTKCQLGVCNLVSPMLVLAAHCPKDVRMVRRTGRWLNVAAV